MRELLQQALEALKTRWNGGRVDIDGDFHSKQTFDEAAMQSAQEAIEAALSRSKWVKVADGLPVVPEGQYVARFWIYDKYGHVSKLRLFAHDSKEHIEQACQSVTHYMPRQDDTPAPPEAS
mgnify:CR=1 FL=1